MCVHNPPAWSNKEFNITENNEEEICLCTGGTLDPTYNEFGYQENPADYFLVNSHWRIWGGARDEPLPPVPFLSFSCSFGENLAK